MSERMIIGDPVELEILSEKLPVETLLVGGNKRWRQKSFQVYIVGAVYQEIWTHIEQTPTIESGGVLVGHPFKDSKGQITFVVITGAIPQHSDDRSVGHFTVGPSEIAASRLELEQNYPGLIVVGWYHSHPGHGVFLSGQDMTIVSNIYNASWHIAMVIDPRHRTEGIFIGKEGKQLGGQGYDVLRGSWLELSQTPDTIRAIAYYNQAQEALDEKRLQEAHKALDKLQSLVQTSEQLTHWREDGYRDTHRLRTRLDEVTNVDKEVIVPQPPRGPYQPPQGTRIFAGLGCHWLSLLSLSIGSAALLALFFFAVTVFYPEQVNSLGTFGFGLLLSLLVTGIIGYVLGIASSVETGDRSKWRNKSLSKLFGVSLSAGLVLLSWCGLSLNIYSAHLGESIFPPVILPSATVTIAPLVTDTATAVPATETLTPIPTFTETATLPPPTETPTETPTLTSTIMLTPTATVTFTATIIPALPLTPTMTLTATRIVTTTIPLEESSLVTQTEIITESAPVSTTLETQ